MQQPPESKRLNYPRYLHFKRTKMSLNRIEKRFGKVSNAGAETSCAFPLESIVKLGNCKTDPKIRTHINRQTVVKRCKFICKRPNLTHTHASPNSKLKKDTQSAKLGSRRTKKNSCCSLQKMSGRTSGRGRAYIKSVCSGKNKTWKMVFGLEGRRFRTL